MEYLLENKKYNINYLELKQKYLEFCDMSDELFLKNLKSIIHFSCVVSWFKDLPNEATLSDIGIIHELVHLLHIPDEPLIDLKVIRNSFREKLELS